jgi:hypothetical protein
VRFERPHYSHPTVGLHDGVNTLSGVVCRSRSGQDHVERLLGTKAPPLFTSEIRQHSVCEPNGWLDTG